MNDRRGAQLLAPTPENIALAAQSLLAGHVVAMPTETVYGLAGVAFDERAITRIFESKERPLFDPLICHIAEKTTGTWVPWLTAQGLLDPTALSPAAIENLETLAAACWPGPLTVVMPKQTQVPDLVTSGLGTVAVRCPRHPVAQQLLRAVGQPLAAPSANRFGCISPTTAAHVMTELGDRIAYILDGGACDIGIESTVLALEPDGALTLLRPGGVSLETVAGLVRGEIHRPLRSPESVASQPSPGLLASHYAPRKPLRLLSKPWAEMSATEQREWLANLAPDACVGLVIVIGDPESIHHQLRNLLAASEGSRSVQVRSLSTSGDLAVAARNLFAILRAFDDADDIDGLWSELVPTSTGLGFAINDRLLRAAHQ
jgi:L-threonylcarbamoyladenylate synthase